MTRRFRTRWTVAAFLVVGAALALWLVVRAATDDSGVSQDEGTAPAMVR
jgi:hypothetical protein